jgi:hypothetical protein
MYIDVIHNLMHNIHMAVSYYTHNGLVYISRTPNTYSKHIIKISGKMLVVWTSGKISHHVDLEVSRTTQTFVYIVII